MTQLIASNQLTLTNVNDGQTAVVHWAYSDNADGTGLTTSDNGQRYIGQYSDNIKTDSADKTKYRWADRWAKIHVGVRNLILNSEQPTWNANDTGLGHSVKTEDETGKFTRTTPSSGKAVSVYGHFYADFENGKFSRSMYVRHFHSSNITIWGQSVPPNV